MSAFAPDGAPDRAALASPTTMLTLQDITVRFGGIVALDSVGLEVRPSEVHGVIGPNGAGKTTLFNVACGFVQPSSGTITWKGEQLNGLRPHHLARHGIARTLQGLGLFDGISVLENVMVGADRHGRAGFWSGLLAIPRSTGDEKALRERSLDVLCELDIEGYADRSPASLPYPIRKRVALARALVSEPELLLLDEPASGLSESEMAELGDIILGLSDRVSVMLVEHHMDLVMRVCSRITVLDFGRVIARGTPDEVREDPAVLAAYLGNEVTHDDGGIDDDADDRDPNRSLDRDDANGDRRA
ncbi:branched-chain amino acid transport system ATP-binding protein [Yimella lutea]|uniref:Branched-chain amino acid transport system ATP-binding protein n=1 Tax=Yimella lutea TaxID=587872 RepID=A0A542EGA7_9MICO|nr:ABC transporter ATP-binding protein [Yimella lutea]TQJ14358.1 branched-chain amino acid transport system ATP-binding protein [Yimella lutea]